ncbi:MAG: hypothetical protein JRJ56_00250 [Deltaproteobacteria bacterium]|jgi:hypothetical protein|nr:hypothetical protein [Deltaproteobacteria bacterium]
MHLHPLTLRFTGPDQELEPLFQDHFFHLSLPVFRWGFALGLLLYAVFAFLDHLSMPEVKYQLWLIRFGLVIPVFAAGIIFSFHSRFKKYWQAVIAILIIVAALGIFWMIAIGPAPANHSYYVGNILVIFYCFTFIRARFIWATITGIIILLMFEVTSIWLSDPPLVILLRNNFFFISALFIGMVSCYSLEYFARENFYHMVKLAGEKAKLARTNEKLQVHLRELEKAQKEIKILSGFLPICANCKKIRDDSGYWQQIESYISAHSEAIFSHALCPDCIEKLYGEEKWFKEKSTN